MDDREEVVAEAAELEEDTAGPDAADGASGSETQPVDEAAEYRDLYMRAVAEMENVRRRARLDVQEAHRYAAAELVTRLIPVIDNLNLALEAAQQSGDAEALRKGVELIQKQFMQALEEAGLSTISAAGQQFDPNYHEAIMQAPAQDGQEPGLVLEELRSGYRLHDRVLRPSLVKVATA